MEIIDHMSLITSKKPTAENEKNMGKMHKVLHDLMKEYNIKPLLNFDTMNKAEAIEAMKAGKKVTHRNFISGEWMTIIGDKLVFDDGVKCSFDFFWSDRRNDSWEDGYRLYTE